MRFWHDKRKPSVTFFLSSPEFCWWRWRQRARVPLPGWDEVIGGVRQHWCPCRVASTCGGGDAPPRAAGQGNLVTAQTMLAKASLASEGGNRSRAASALFPWQRQRSMAEVTPLPALIASCSCWKTQAHRCEGGFGHAQLSLGAQGFYRLFPT